MIRIAVATLFVLHGLLHVFGFIEGFGYVDLPQLTEPVSPVFGLLWLAAGLLCCAAGVALFVAPGWWWAVGALALALSQIVIITSWSDAKVGTVANLVLLAAVIQGWASRGPYGLRAQYERNLTRSWTRPGELVTEADLVPLPEPVRRYLRRAGVVDRPRVRDFRATWTGRIRKAPDSEWMTFTADQLDTVAPARRYFLMDARMKGLPVDVLHTFDDRGATMRVRLLSIRSMVNANGAGLTRAETVTMFNDLCLYAPSALVGTDITWDAIDAHAAVAHFAFGSNVIVAELRFDDDGDLVDFVSDDRAATSPDGRILIPLRWSTPVRDYTHFGSARVARKAEVRWHPADGAWTYGEFELTSLAYDVTRVRLPNGRRPSRRSRRRGGVVEAAVAVPVVN